MMPPEEIALAFTIGLVVLCAWFMADWWEEIRRWRK